MVTAPAIITEAATGIPLSAFIQGTTILRDLPILHWDTNQATSTVRAVAIPQSVHRQVTTMPAQEISLKEQQKTIDAQNTVMKDLKGEMANLRAEVNKLKSKDMTAQK